MLRVVRSVFLSHQAPVYASFSLASMFVALKPIFPGRPLGIAGHALYFPDFPSAFRHREIRT